MTNPHSKALLRDFAEKNGLLDYEFYVDVGFPVIVFSENGLSNDGGKETGCSWMITRCC